MFRNVNLYQANLGRFTDVPQRHLINPGQKKGPVGQKIEGRGVPSFLRGVDRASATHRINLFFPSHDVTEHSNPSPDFPFRHTIIKTFAIYSSPF